MTKDEKDLEKLKKNYEEIEKKYDLPSFKELNENFHVEKVAEVNTEILIREIRRFIGDKLVNYMRFIENLLNPVNVPMFIFSMVKLLDADDKKQLSEIYKKLIKIEVKFIELDLDFKEEKEAEFIKESYKLWQGVKKDILKIMNKINKKWDEKSETGNKGYFG